MSGFCFFYFNLLAAVFVVNPEAVESLTPYTGASPNSIQGCSKVHWNITVQMARAITVQ